MPVGTSQHWVCPAVGAQGPQRLQRPCLACICHCAQIKFFERVKLERAIKKLQRQLTRHEGGGTAAAGLSSEDQEDTADGEEGEEGEQGEEGQEAGGGEAKAREPFDPEAAQARLAQLKDDLMYVMHFPKVR